MRAISGRWRLVAILAIAGMLIWGGATWWDARRYRIAMEQIEDDIEHGLHALAARNLAMVLADRPDSDEAHLLLGNCEIARGRTEAAVAAWARVRADSRFAPRAILGQMQIEMERGRLSEAERIITVALADPRVDGSSLPILLGPVYCQQGRVDETLRLIEARWKTLSQANQGASESAINLVRAHVDLRRNTVPVEMIRFSLDQAARMAPDDDRVLLGRANLAIRTGAYEEAGQLLDVCRRRRPDDVAVWRARLDWAMAGDRVAEARECLGHLPAEESSPAQVYRLTAWFAGRQRAIALERTELERLIEIDPADHEARERLAQLFADEGNPEHAADLRASRSKVEQLVARYQKLFDRNQPRRDAVEMARLANQLGQRFEARGFLTFALALDPVRKDLRDELATLDNHGTPIGRPRGTLADLIAPELDSASGEAARRMTSMPAGAGSRPQ